MSWTKYKSAQESLEILGTVSEECARLGGNLSKALNELVKSGKYAELIAFDISYADLSLEDLPVLDYIYSRQILGLFQKAEFLDLGIDRESVAAERFVKSEKMCREANYRIRSAALRPQDVEPDIRKALSLAQWKIASVLGDVPPLDKITFSFGPGANTNVSGRQSNPRMKLGAPLACSADLSPTVAVFLSETPHWTALHSQRESDDSYIVEVQVVPGKVMFVPKNAKTDRTISIEPLLNGFFQKGVGDYMRDCLKRSGVDLRDQTRNQSLARRGSIDGSLATVDLSMASDCLSRELVWDLLPLPWAELLSSLRTSEVTVPDSVAKHAAEFDGRLRDGVLRLEKFSSMGNGYTFELESVIFYGLCYGVCRALGIRQKDVSVYGDDLIVPVESYDLLRRVLTHCGFSINLDKSFCSGPFRESCGADYLNGFDIRPFYQKTRVSEATLFSMHNWFLRNGEFELAAVVANMCNPAYKLFGPDGFGDGHLVGSFELRQNRKTVRAGWDGGYFDTYALRERSCIKPSPGDAVLPVYSVYTRSGKDSPTDPDVVRGSSGYAKISIYTLGRSIFARKV